eukprot:TRINITY_DN39923_c0_g1_i1.p1 TRINITY_DN39923_c0_g1~~TRINITY_DN39923_c0_g1_i1.p1  ORF type:complete len:733 (-),score=246.01 TRINITY_DN39923_c0_g1_i1:93-2291(-)
MMSDMDDEAESLDLSLPRGGSSMTFTDEYGDDDMDWLEADTPSSGFRQRWKLATVEKEPNEQVFSRALHSCVFIATKDEKSTCLGVVVFFGGTFEGQVYHDLRCLRVPLERSKPLQFIAHPMCLGPEPVARAAHGSAVVATPEGKELAFVFGGTTSDQKQLGDAFTVEYKEEDKCFVYSMIESDAAFRPCGRSYLAMSSCFAVVKNTDPHQGGDAKYPSTLTREVVVMFGGFDGAKALNDLWAFDFESNGWIRVDSVVGEPPLPRIGHVMVEFGDQGLILFGGYNGTTRFDDMFLLRTTHWPWEWEQVTIVSTDRPSARAGHAIAPMSEGQWIMHGGDDGSESFSDEIWMIRAQWKGCHEVTSGSQGGSVDILDSEPPDDWVASSRREWEFIWENVTEKHRMSLDIGGGLEESVSSSAETPFSLMSGRNGHVAVNLRNGTVLYHGGDNGAVEVNDLFIFEYEEEVANHSLHDVMMMESEKATAELEVAEEERRKAELELEEIRNRVEEISHHRKDSDRNVREGLEELERIEEGRKRAQQDLNAQLSRLKFLQDERSNAEKEINGLKSRVERLEMLKNKSISKSERRALVKQLIREGVITPQGRVGRRLHHEGDEGSPDRMRGTSGNGMMSHVSPIGSPMSGSPLSGSPSKEHEHRHITIQEDRVDDHRVVGSGTMHGMIGPKFEEEHVIASGSERVESAAERKRREKMEKMRKKELEKERKRRQKEEKKRRK